MRTLTYAQAIREAHAQLLASDQRVFIIGQGLWSPWYVGGSMSDLEKEFGHARVIDTPVSENATTGMAVGAALAGMRPIVVHPRMDFMALAIDPIINQAANWSYMFGGQAGVPLVIRPIINRGGEQGAQHSQALHAFFLHVPGVKVVMPAVPEDAKGMLIAAVYDGNPVMYIDDRWLYDDSGPVSEAMDRAVLGEAMVRREGGDVTLVAAGYLVPRALAAAEVLRQGGIDAEIIDLRTIKPWDKTTICRSVAKTRRLVVADGGWVTGGVAAEIVASVVARLHGRLLSAPVRVGLPDAPAPTASSLESAYYPDTSTLVAAVEAAMVNERPPANPRPTRRTPGQIVFG